MFRRRRREPDDPDVSEDAGTPEAEEAPTDAPVDVLEEPDAPKSPRPDGPWDVSELDEDGEGPDRTAAGAGRGARVDLGGLLVRGSEGMALQLQVDEGSDRVSAALVVHEDSAVQLLAVAAPRSSGLWPQVRAEMAADARAHGAQVEEADGPFGAELRVLLPVTLPDGGDAVQPSRVVAVDGPRWLLRATFLGRASAEAEPFDRLAAVVRDVVVVRGDAPMAPGDLIALRLPDGAVRADADAAGARAQRPTLEDLDPGPTITEIR